MAEHDDDAEVITLNRLLNVYDQAIWEYSANGTSTPEYEAFKKDRLAAWSNVLFPAITTTAEWRVKLLTIEHLDRTANLTPREADRGNHADALAWAIVRGFVAERAAV